MDRREYLGQSMMQAAVLPARAAYLIRVGSDTGFRQAVQEASTRWGGMTEPILVVPENGEVPDELRETVATAKVEAVVNVDVDDTVAQRAAAALGLPCIRIAQIDQAGAAMFTCHPLHVNPPVQPSTLPVVAVDGAPLWQVTAAGLLSEEQADELRRTALAVRSGQPDEYGRTQMYGATHLQSTIAQFGEHRSNAFGSLPAAVWVTEPDDVEDCVAFWNARALRPVSHAGMPMLLLPTGEVQHWLGLAQQLAGMLCRPAEFSPDVMLLSRNVPQEQLHEIAEVLELQRTEAEVRIGTQFPTPALRQPPFTYRTGLDPRSWLLRDREYGLSTSLDVHVFAGDTSTLRFTSPVHFHTQGSWALVRVWGSPLDGLPRRDCVASLVEKNAQWRGDSIQLRTPAQNDYIFALTVPTLAQAAEAVLEQASARHALSDKGKLGVALQAQADIASLLEPGVYEAVIAKLEEDALLAADLLQLSSQLPLHPPLGTGVDLVDQGDEHLHQGVGDLRLPGGAQGREQRDPYVLGGVSEVRGVHLDCPRPPRGQQLLRAVREQPVGQAEFTYVVQLGDLRQQGIKPDRA